MEILKASLTDVVRSVARWTALNRWPLADLGGNARAVAWGVGNCFIVALANGASITEIDLRVRPYKGEDIYNPNRTACETWNDLLDHCKDMGWISDFRGYRYQAYDKLTLKKWAETPPDATWDETRYLDWALDVTAPWEHAVPDASTREAAARFFEWLEGAEDNALQPMMGVAPVDKDDVQLTASTERGEMVKFELTFKGTLDQFRATVRAIESWGDIPTESQLLFLNTVSLDDGSAFFPHLATFSFCLLLDHNRCIDQSHYDDEKNKFVYFQPKYGHLIVQSLPDNKSRLVVEVGEEVWPKLAQPWRLFQAELARQGWVEPRPTATGTTDTAQPLTSAVLDDEQVEGTLPPKYRARLYTNLAKHFSQDELRTLSFILGIEHENLPGTRDGMARGLVEHCERIGRVPDLVGKCKELRPNIVWEDKSK